MRSILEKALIALLNTEKDKADALFHDFILERSRQIHESLRQGEDFVLDESWEKELAVDEMFTEADLMGEDDDAEDSDEQVNEFAEDGFGADSADSEAVAGDDVADMDDEVADDSADDSVLDAEGEVDGEEGIEGRVDDLEAELFRLAAEFDALVSGEDETVDSVRGDLEGDDFGAVEGDDVAGDDFGTDDDFSVEEEGFDPMRESALSDLDKVNVKMADGVEQGGKSFTQNKKSPGLQPKLQDRALKGEPVEIKAKEHSGYEKEAAPSVETMKARKNSKSKAADGRTPVKKEGDSSAMLNDLKTNKGDDKSIIGSTKVPMGKN